MVWNAYIDSEGTEIEIPKHVLVTSKSDVRRNRKGQLVYYALICKATEPLSVGDYGPFDSANYKNIGDDGKRIGPSQVTALVERASNAAGNTKHRINLQAKLALDYWVRLSQPREIPADCELQRLVVENREHNWIDKVTEIREGLV